MDKEQTAIATIRTHPALRVLKLLDASKNHHNANGKPNDTEGKEEQAEQKATKGGYHTEDTQEQTIPA